MKWKQKIYKISNTVQCIHTPEVKKNVDKFFLLQLYKFVYLKRLIES